MSELCEFIYVFFSPCNKRKTALDVTRNINGYLTNNNYFHLLFFLFMEVRYHILIYFFVVVTVQY